ncbi:TRAP transporter substrate-binding protein [Neolewinella antarctica]|uniref:Tripartite ATP-independent transporter DctP family solute receptor n=1 Tax=Neolewinella antarctica TaxID=442734 RepID=A0ABX0XCA1_9BACT|nr:TRAP transporter substrate-binding protein [Neolewinella antarctica]NJC26880.1 tripartite ATP-independent transporter DctP family solute receptor [Neolewinella antarctica]
MATTCLLLLLFTSCQDLAGKKVIYLAHTLPTSHPVHQGMEVFAESVRASSQGQLDVKIFPDGQLGSEREVLELLQIGSIAMTKVSAATMANFAPEYQVLGVPYLFRDKDHMFDVLEGPTGKEILEAGSDYLLKGLCFYDAGSRSFYTVDKPIKTPEDLSGMKIRVMSAQMSVDMVNAMGGSATPMSYGELYSALEQGVVDGAENNPPSFVTSRHYEIAKYYTLDEHSSVPDVLVMGTEYWGTLDDQQQAWVMTAARESAEAQKQFWSDNVEASMKILAEAGVEVFRPEKSLFAESSKSVLIEFGKDERMRKLVESIQAQ